MIDAKNINVKFGKRLILKDLNFKVNKGEYISIIGKSGAGKSTLLNVISTLEKEYSGNVFYKNKDIRDYNDVEISNLRNKKIGFIFQNFNLLEDFTVIENIMLPARLTKIDEMELKEKALELINKFELDLTINQYPNELSGGEKQRVAIARALINKPEIIFADEPTGNLDSRMSIEISNILSKLNQEGQTIVMVTHNKELAKNSNKILELKDGMLLN
ncbi:ABC transporter ATP-binding protein [Bacteroidota bacterium]|nr:ABC transporter ATP-binding protein [Bacteroidota bacterium]MDC3230531.1 ABC transporter ATP-binding protein [Bacteroidota bacterium]